MSGVVGAPVDEISAVALQSLQAVMGPSEDHKTEKRDGTTVTEADVSSDLTPAVEVPDPSAR